MIAGERLAPEQFDTLPEIVEPAENPVLMGHQDEVDAIVAAFRSGRMHHALLLHGPRGIGKATLAFAIARHLLANPDEKTAPEILTALDPGSSLFRQVATGAHPGVLHLTRPIDKDGKKFRTAITVDEIRRVSKFLSMKSHDGGFRTIIVDPADDMNTSAANALLKNLEEPPPRCLFILISHAPGRLLPTIKSRCQIMRLQPLPEDQLLAVLAALGEELPPDKAERGEIARHAEGSPRNALLMTRYGGLELARALADVTNEPQMDMDAAYRLAEAVSARDAEVQLSILNDLVMEQVAERARIAGLQGDSETSARLSDLWFEVREAVSAAGTYNLDKKQHVLGLITKLRDGFRL